MALGVFERRGTPDPGRSVAGHVRHAAGPALWIQEVIETHFERWARGWGEVGGRRRGHVEDSQRVMGEVGVAPEPELFPVEARVDDAVAALHGSIAPVEMLAELMAFREEPAPREPSEPLGQDATFHRDREFLAGLRPQADAFVAEVIGDFEQCLGIGFL